MKEVGHHQNPTPKVKACVLEELLRVFALGRVTLVICAAALTGCASIGPLIIPERVAVPIEKGGRLLPIDLTLHKCSHLSPTVYFSRKELVGKNDIRLVGALPGERWKMMAGAPIHLKVTFHLMTSDKSQSEEVFRLVDVTTYVIEAWTDNEVGRIFGGVTLPAGNYRVQATLLEGVPELSNLHPVFELSSNFKDVPSSEECAKAR